MRRVFPTFFVIVGACVSGACGQTEVLFEVGSDEQDPLLHVSEYYEPISFDGETYLRLNRDIYPGAADPYSKVSWDFLFRIRPNPPKNPLVVEIAYFDEGAGIIEPSLHAGGRWHSPSKRASYTRLNTGKIRRAYFQFSTRHMSNFSDRANFRITGLQHLKSITLHREFSEAGWERARGSVPTDVEPMVELGRPMQLVTTAGIAVQGDTSTLQASLDTMHELAPLAKALGFTSIESYVTWNRIEPAEGQFDFSYYDAIVSKLREYDLKWFPLLIVGSAYALPEWFLNSEENVGFECLEHGARNDIQSIWSPHHPRHVERVLKAFGDHYGPMDVLEGVRLGPSGNYGESQYPAGGSWPPLGEESMHIHIGWWADDPYALEDFRKFVRERYGEIDEVNDAWRTKYQSFNDVKPVLPEHMAVRRHRLDFTEWYTDSMSAWCAWWAEVAREALPGVPMYQSAGGWGFREAGTDYVAQTKAMVPLDGGIRLTNETDSFEQNFYATRLAATAARLFGATLGFEPASSHTARGVVGRIFNTTATNGDHFFTYHGNVFNHQLSIEKWLENLPMLETRIVPIIDVAVYYPETMNQLNDGAFRHLYGWGFNPRAREIRRQIEVDYLDETLIREGYLDRYKALVFVWGNVIPADVQQVIDAWIQEGGVAFYPSFPKGDQVTVDGDRTVFRKWMSGDIGQGAFHRFPGDMEPPSLYAEWIAERLKKMQSLHPLTRTVLSIDHPEHVFFSIQQNESLLALNYSEEIANVELEGRFKEFIAPYSIARIPLRVRTIELAQMKR